MGTFRGIIALDIDGTIADRWIPQKTADFLNELITQGWCLALITGRTYSFAAPLLNVLKGRYYLAVQNGAAFYEMPSLQLLKKHYLSGDNIDILNRYFITHGMGWTIEMGKEQKDKCYYQPTQFSPEEREYLEFRISISKGVWIAVDSFDFLKNTDFACGKFFGSQEQMTHLQQHLPYTVTPIRDLFRPPFYLAHINSSQASKGAVLNELKKKIQAPAIAAGDDVNDISMLQMADIKIVMANAPDFMHALADVIAPPVSEEGIIIGLKKAINLIP